MKFIAFNPLPVMVPYGADSVGLLEKRVLATSSLGLTDTAESYGDKNKSLWDTMTLLDQPEWHNNHGEDPATDNLALTDSATLKMDMLRPVETVMTLTDYAHASLDGYHPPGSGNGSDYDPSYEMTANEAVLIGQPVYVSGNNTINLASAADTTAARAVGLVEAGASAGGTAKVLSDGPIEQPNWSNVTGSALLTPGSVYYLSLTYGQMTLTPPSGDGETVVMLGTALTTTKFDIEVNEVAIL